MKTQRVWKKSVESVAAYTLVGVALAIASVDVAWLCSVYLSWHALGSFVIRLHPRRSILEKA